MKDLVARMLRASLAAAAICAGLAALGAGEAEAAIPAAE
jgi:hypothetical protein